MYSERQKSCPEKWWKHLIITNHLTSVCRCCLGFSVVRCMWEFIRLNNDTTSVSHCKHQYVWYIENYSFGTTHHLFTTLYSLPLWKYPPMTSMPCLSYTPYSPLVCPGLTYQHWMTWPPQRVSSPWSRPPSCLHCAAHHAHQDLSTAVRLVLHQPAKHHTVQISRG